MKLMVTLFCLGFLVACSAEDSLDMAAIELAKPVLMRTGEQAQIIECSNSYLFYLDRVGNWRQTHDKSAHFGVWTNYFDPDDAENKANHIEWNGRVLLFYKGLIRNIVHNEVSTWSKNDLEGDLANLGAIDAKLTNGVWKLGEIENIPYEKISCDNPKLKIN